MVFILFLTVSTLGARRSQEMLCSEVTLTSMKIISGESLVLPAACQHCTTSFDVVVLQKIGLRQWGGDQSIFEIPGKMAYQQRLTAFGFQINYLSYHCSRGGKKDENLRKLKICGTSFLLLCS